MSSEAKFTPGPWAVAGCFVTTADDTVLATVNGSHLQKHGDVKLPGKSNAALMAAAPDLYAALLQAVEMITKHVPIDALGSNYEGDPEVAIRSWPILEEHLHYMRAALAKVVGQ